MKKNTAEISIQSRSAMIENITTAINELQDAGNFDGGFNTPFLKFEAEALKSKKEWINSNDISSIFFESMHIQKLEIAQKLGVDAYEVDLYSEPYRLDPIRISSVANSVIKTLSEIPANYFVNFPLPELIIDEDIAITDEISIIRPSQNGGNIFVEHQPAYVRIKARGYFTNHRERPSMREVSSKLKQFIQVAINKEILIRGNNKNPHLYSKSYQEMLSAKIYAEDDPQKVLHLVPLTGGMSNYLNSLRPRSIFNFTQNLIDNFIQTMSMMNSDLSEENSHAIKSALEWSFDAAADDDETMRFLKTCIGLEAILGDASEQGGITERIADRCAYLLRNTTTQRKNTRNVMRDLYQLRSKLVHGVVTKFSHSDERHAEMGQIYLNSVISAELRSLENWWKANRS